jgi:hypothetical protein
MSRDGCVVVLGAGASVDAGYPMAKDLHEAFEAEVVRIARDENARALRIAAMVKEEVDSAAGDPNKIAISLVDPDAFDRDPSISDVFQSLWQTYAQAAVGVPSLDIPQGSGGRPSAASRRSTGVEFHPFSTPQYSKSTGVPHLEGFFAYYDRLLDPEFLPFLSMTTAEAEAYAISLRKLRLIAIDVAYQELGPGGRETADYLIPLASVVGPNGTPPTIATLNFDVALERALAGAGVAYDDGFRPTTADAINPLKDEHSNLSTLWIRASQNMDSYQGFDKERRAIHLLKLHGSLGWYVLEEGNGDIGWPPPVRNNVPYGTFRLAANRIWADHDPQLPQCLATGAPIDPALAGTPSVSRKAGSVWLRPLLEYARSTKTHPSVLSTDLMSTFIDSMASASTVLVVGYSWGDTHINDSILEAISQGARLVNLGYEPMPQSLMGLLANKFATTFRSVFQRTYAFGGGAKAILGDHRPRLPDGSVVDLDVLRDINELPQASSLNRL